jgi:hypothetical protein
LGALEPIEAGSFGEDVAAAQLNCEGMQASLHAGDLVLSHEAAIGSYLG